MNSSTSSFQGMRHFFLALAILLIFLASGASTYAQNRPLGTDVSSYQGSTVNWSALRTDGISFAWAKATEGTYFIDADFKINEANAKSAGVYIGAYHFARPSDDPNITGANSADTEAQYFWNEAGSYIVAGGGYLVPMLDWEDPYITNNASLTQSVLSQWVNEWCNDVSNYARANGVVIRPVVYTGEWYCNSATYRGLNTSVTNWPVWLSAYPSCTKVGSTEECGTTAFQTSNPGATYPWPTWNIWQYGDTNWSGGDSDVYNGTTNQFLQQFVIGYSAAASGLTLYWDPFSVRNSPGSGGNGLWDATSQDWWYAGSSNVSWAIAGDNPIFAGTAGTVTLNAALTASTLTFNTPGYTITGSSTLTLANNPATITIVGPSGAPTIINSPLTATAVNVSGGPLVLNNTANSLRGPISILTNSALQIAASGALGLTSGILTLNSNSSFQNNDSVSGDAFLNSSVSLTLRSGPGTLSVNSGSLTYGGDISGAGSLIKSGAGTLTLTAANAYSGSTTISQGGLTLGSAGSLASSVLAIGGGATLDVSANPAWSLAASFTASGNGTLVGSNAATIRGASGAVINMGSYPITLVFNPTATNGDSLHPALYVSQGTLELNHGNTIVVSNISGSPLGVGVYALIQQATGGVSNAPYPTPLITGSGVSPGTTNHFVLTNKYMFLVVANVTTTTLNPLGASTYGQAVTLNATVSPSPSAGTVQFYDNGTALGNPAPVNAGAASLTVNTLTAGSHTITALYGGVTSYGMSWSGSATQQVSAAPLTITAGALSKAYGQTMTFGPGSSNFTSSGLVGGDTVGSVTLSVNNNGGNAAAPVGAYVITPSAAAGGTFLPANYSMTYNPGTLTVTLPPNTVPMSISGPLLQADGAVQLTFNGTPGYVYYIQAACDLSPPVNWVTIATNEADSNGWFNFTDEAATNYPSRFYRTQAQ